MAKTKRKSSTSKRRSPGALGGRAKQTPWSRLGISKKQYEAANKWGSKMANLPQGKKFRKEVKKRVQRASPQDLRDIKPIARNVAGMAGDVEKWVKTQAPRNLQNPDRASVSTQAQMAKKTRDVGRDIELMGEYPTEGEFQRARSFRSSWKEPLAEERFQAGGGPLKKPSKKKGSTSKRRSPGALGGKRKQTYPEKLGVSKKVYEDADKYSSKLTQKKGGKKLKKEVEKRMGRDGKPVSASAKKDLQSIAHDLARQTQGIDKFKKTLPPGSRNIDEADPSTQFKVAKKIKDVHADTALMGEYPSKGEYRRARSFGSSRGSVGEARFEGGGPVKRNSRDGYARGGLTKVAREDDSTTLMQAGGYLGGLTESGRGTMAGELGPRGSLPVREAGETMYERSKRRRGFKGGGAVSSYNRRYNNQNK